ncbi:YggS family pyridoxal phosphate-dependent enzyme [Holdemania massiliensis]|uniref:Pyridoxal phosphate homeostasis protein n=1 Tax=Holdemania massiliensis TaxID=1468449 RepID=A0A6N7S2Q6_9FIRM|nr:YggS family pyridoxal phosphate-dependent enzyme [Holdemania massiliensis]MSA69772.1 YggS family pyridoxal phosphate-dependent enzyme [Holdemania massiliensis]MSA87982.1 YggS family pyridoxal phosphate-dependent enzyme [Holdemania massiliensis]MSB76852.1 YggS family pyridoxal phosphate-dependent enzyme [Holdemania massiliensis]MSC31778.1 YggS family pyridoxal phosphate-dependent enzyme [Holdemania massiliensis]MSC38098.1 YggS family pyridoxal phosphate-dependent enzyme [Holdemania massilien
MPNLYKTILQQCPEQCELLIVSKHRSVEQIQAYYDQGARNFGENRVQELLQKAPQLPQDIRWNFIGHLQRNKVRAVMPYISRLCSLDSLALAAIVDKEAARLNRTLGVLVEFNLAEESSKTGLAKQEAAAFFQALQQYEHLIPEGIMVMGPHVDDEAAIAAVFHEARALFEELKAQWGGEHFTVCSMGMSHDYPIALREGSTQLRLGTILFEDPSSI